MSKKYEKIKPFLKKIGSGNFTGKSLNREESAKATKLIPKDADLYMDLHHLKISLGDFQGAVSARTKSLIASTCVFTLLLRIGIINF